MGQGEVVMLTNQVFHKGILWVYLNGRCNFTCEYCLDDRNSLPGAIDDHPDYISRLVSLQNLLGFSLVLTGGEPMLSFQTVLDIYKAFPHVPKCIQTNGALPDRLAKLMLFCRPHDWFSISYHQETLEQPVKQKAVNRSIDILVEAGLKVHIQFMCSPKNIPMMLEQAAQYGERGCKVSMRRLFEHSPDLFEPYMDKIRKVNSDPWATAAFFLHEDERRQPFNAAVIYLDGTIAMVCSKEIKVGNLYTGYDLTAIEPYRTEMCDRVCHCCSCKWVDYEWGFA